MECDALDYNFPFVTRTHQLIDSNTCLDTTLKSDLMFLKWFLALSKHEQKLRLCPDILYLTYETVKGIVFGAHNTKYIRIIFVKMMNKIVFPYREHFRSK